MPTLKSFFNYTDGESMFKVGILLRNVLYGIYYTGTLGEIYLKFAYGWLKFWYKIFGIITWKAIYL